jgi:hypothetical protein
MKNTKTDPAVDALLAKLVHPLAAEIAAGRKLILGASAEISEGVKWNSASYKTSDWFATLNWRSKESVQFVLHLGAKPKGKVLPRKDIPDERGLLKWLAPDRAVASLGSGKEFKGNSKAFAALIKEWVKYV